MFHTLSENSAHGLLRHIEAAGSLSSFFPLIHPEIKELLFGRFCVPCGNARFASHAKDLSPKEATMIPARRFADDRAFFQLWRQLIRFIARRYSWIGSEVIQDAVMEAVLLLVKQDKRCPRNEEEENWKLSLSRAACRNVCNQLRDNKRRVLREQEYAGQKKKKKFCSGNGSAEHIETDEGKKLQRQRLDQMLRALTNDERAFVELRKRGAQDVRSYAELLGVEERTPEEQQRAVKREWDRLRMKLRRMAGESGCV